MRSEPGHRAPVAIVAFRGLGRWVVRPLLAMEKRIHLLLICWIMSDVGHAVLSIFYEKGPAVYYVPALRLVFVLVIVGAWRRHRWSVKMCAIASIAAIAVQGGFIWSRDAYGAL